MLLRHMAITGAILGGFAVAGTTLVALTEHDTKDEIAHNEQLSLQRKLNKVIPPDAYDNDLAADTTQVSSKELLGAAKPVTVYRARKHGEPVAAIFTAIAPDGYTGTIKLLIAVRDSDETILGVRVIEHHETPGLGDWIEAERSDWIQTFSSHSLSNPDELGWRVKDGGIFDQFTGAAVTPRAVVKAVHKGLKYYHLHKAELYRPEAGATAAAEGDT